MIPAHLRYFIELADRKSFTKAAESLFISQSTISKALSSLELELHTRLYEHGNRHFTLTQSGKMLYAFAIDVLNYYDDQEKLLLTKIERADNKLRLGVPPTAGSIFFFVLINDFERMFPEIHLSIRDITSKYMPDLLMSGELDLGIVIEPFHDKRFIKRIAYETEAVLVVSNNHPLAKKDSLDFHELEQEQFLQVTRDFQYRAVFEDYCDKAGFSPDVCFESNQWDMILEMVADGRGVTVLPLPLVEKFRWKGIHSLRLTKPAFPWALTVIYPEKMPITHSMQKFLNLI